MPDKVIQQRYGDDVFNEVVRDILHKSLKEALEEKQLTPASTPRVGNLQASKEEPLRYEVNFEIYPEIELADMGQISLEEKSSAFLMRMSKKYLNACANSNLTGIWLIALR